MHPYDWFLDNTDNCDSGLPALPLDPLPVLEPIKVKPVELNAQLWAEWKRAAASIPWCRACGALSSRECICPRYVPPPRGDEEPV